MSAAYRALARASALILDGGGDVMRPPLLTAAPAAAGAAVSHPPLAAGASQGYRVRDLRRARDILDEACAAADHIVGGARDQFTAAERALWQYGREVVDGIADYVEAAALIGDDWRRRGSDAIDRIGEAVTHVRDIDLPLKGTWGAYDIEWVRNIWMTALRRRFGNLEA